MYLLCCRATAMTEDTKAMSSMLFLGIMCLFFFQHTTEGFYILQLHPENTVSFLRLILWFIWGYLRLYLPVSFFKLNCFTLESLTQVVFVSSIFYNQGKMFLILVHSTLSLRIRQYLLEADFFFLIIYKKWHEPVGKIEISCSVGKLHEQNRFKQNRLHETAFT